MSTVKKITRQSMEELIKAGNRVEEIAQALSIPKGKVKEGMKHFGLKFPRAGRGGTVVLWEDEDTNDNQIPEISYEATEAQPTAVVEDDLKF
jgi:hypothetical protein